MPQETNAPRTAEAKARDVVVLAVRRRADHGGERAHGPALGTRQPFRLVLRRGDGGNEPDLCPVEDAAREGRPQPRQALEARAHGRKALELARGEAQPLPTVVAEPAEAELVMAAAAKKRPREPAEDHPTARVLRREPAEPAVEDERGVVRAEATPVRFRRDEHVGRHVHAFSEH